MYLHVLKNYGIIMVYEKKKKKMMLLHDFISPQSTELGSRMKPSPELTVT